MPKASVAARRIPVFALYGEEAVACGPGFVHTEGIAERAPLHGWTISPHRHGDLAQAILVTRGEGQIVLDDRQQQIAAPCLLWLPVGAVHGLSFSGTADGKVLTIADTFLAAALAGAPDETLLRDVAETAFAGPLPATDEIDLDVAALVAVTSHEARSGLSGSASAVSALLRLLMVALHRSGGVAGRGPEEARDAALFRRFRSLLESHFRDHWQVSRYASELAVSIDRLHAACAAAAGRSPREVLHDRIMLEARRDLIYTSLPVSQVAFGLGFEDPAYFSRFFAQRAGMSAAAFRKAHTATADRRG